MPHLSLGDEDVIVLSWHKSVGDIVKVGEPLLEVETEKATMDVEASVEGTLTAQECTAGDAISPGALIGYVTTTDEPRDGHRGSSLPPEQPSDDAVTRPNRGDELPTTPVASAPPSLVLGGELRGLPATTADAVISEPSVGVDDPQTRPGSYSDQRLTRRRRAIARRLADAATIPQFAVTRRISLGPAREIVDALRATVHASITDVVLHAVAAAATESPAINAWLLGETVRSFEHVCIALAVETDDGVVAPVLPNVELLNVAEITTLRVELVERARSGRLRVDDLEGATLTLSNVGPMGADQLLPILTPPQVGVVGIGRDTDDGAVFTFVGDHRVLDGADGARFLTRLDAALSPNGFV
jgi:pyruvate dehydrogenase E2 component (dihydrolipoamide acetyltransferase)